jgi:uncharacterized protein YggU (UPF0235/DUF167 family)
MNNYNPNKFDIHLFAKFNSSGKIWIQETKVTISLVSGPEQGKSTREHIQKLVDHLRVSRDEIHMISR